MEDDFPFDEHIYQIGLVQPPTSKKSIKSQVEAVTAMAERMYDRICSRSDARGARVGWLRIWEEMICSLLFRGG